MTFWGIIQIDKGFGDEFDPVFLGSGFVHGVGETVEGDVESFDGSHGCIIEGLVGLHEDVLRAAKAGVVSETRRDVERGATSRSCRTHPHPMRFDMVQRQLGFIQEHFECSNLV